MTTLFTNRTEVLWTLPPPMDNAYMQFYFGKLTILMNFKSEEMNGYICPTDSRYRGDLRLYEEGHVELADAQKTVIEQRQRRVRKLIEDGTMPKWKPQFFREIDHPYAKADGIFKAPETSPKFYELVEGEKGYWERRENQDWSDMPNLWGPFTD